MLNTARNLASLKRYRNTSYDGSGLNKTVLPPPMLGKSMGHGILNESF
jgi:hypothetical protein